MKLDSKHLRFVLKPLAALSSLVLAILVFPSFANAFTPGTQVGSTSSPVPVTVTFTTGGNVASINVLSQGLAGSDYTDAVTGDTCLVGTSYNAGDTCTVNVKFAPKAPGIRPGAVSLFDGSGILLGTANLSQLGISPVVAFAGISGGAWIPSSTRILGSGFNAPGGVAVDTHGNVFVADTANNAVKEILATAGTISASPTILTLATGFNGVYGIAVDGNGDVFVADYGDAAVKEILSVNGAIPGTPTVVTLGASFSGPTGVAVDTFGNVFVADYEASEVKEIVAVNGVIPASPTVKILGSGFSNPVAVAIDSQGNLFVTDSYNGAVKEIHSVANVSASAVRGFRPMTSPVSVATVGSGFTLPYGLAVDPIGNLYVSDVYNNTVKLLAAVGGTVPASPVTTVLGGGFSNPFGLAVDGRGNVYVADYGSSSIKQMAFAYTPAFKFASTSQYSPSSDSPQTVQLLNLGNASLVITGLTFPSNFVQPAVTNPCSASTSLSSGSSCNLAIEFLPQVTGKLSGSVVVTDNTLNLVGKTQSIAVRAPRPLSP